MDQAPRYSYRAATEVQDTEMPALRWWPCSCDKGHINPSPPKNKSTINILIIRPHFNNAHPMVWDLQITRSIKSSNNTPPHWVHHSAVVQQLTPAELTQSTEPALVLAGWTGVQQSAACMCPPASLLTYRLERMEGGFHRLECNKNNTNNCRLIQCNTELLFLCTSHGLEDYKHC